MTYIDINGTTLYYEDAGSGPASSGRTLLLLHGWGTSGRVWGGQLPDLVTDHRVVTLDWRGCGRSAHPVAGNTVDGVVADLTALVEALQLRRPVVVGSSIGATFATEFALSRPDLVGGVIAVGGPAYFPSTGMPLDDLRAGLRERRAGTVLDWVQTWFAPGTDLALVHWTARQVLDSGVYADEQFVGAATYDPRPALPGLRVPLHHIHGDLDAIPVEVARTCADLAPGGRLTVMRGVGHMPHQERPGEFTSVLRAALAPMGAVAGAMNGST